MEIAVKFVTIRQYDFISKTDGQRVVGKKAICYEPKTKKVIEVKIKHENVVRDKEFGDDITVLAVPNGRYINYEV